MSDLFEQRRARFSPCRTWRYSLERVWSTAPLVNFLMLNPSTADENANDPTVERCQRRDLAWGHGGLVVTNLFAFRATDPADMKAAPDPVGPENDAAIVEAARSAGLVVCAWGTHGVHRGRAEHVVALLRGAGVQLHALRISSGGEPCHPLYLPYTLTPFVWEPAAPAASASPAGRSEPTA